jgi:hypothetical protein
MKFLSGLREWLLDDFLWKLFSLLLAVSIWVTVHHLLVGGQVTLPPPNAATVTFGNIQVLIMARAADVHNYRVRPEVVSVTVSGSPAAISVVQANSIRVSVDLTDIESAKDLDRPVDVSMPPGISLVSVSPPRVSVVIPRH